MTEEHKDKLRELAAIRSEAFKKFAEVVVTLSGGLLGIMVTFLSDIKELDKNVGWLITGWSAFMLCMALGSLYLLKDTIIAAKGYKLLEKNSSIETVEPPFYFVWIHNLLPAIFTLAIGSLFVFAVSNIR